MLLFHIAFLALSLTLSDHDTRPLTLTVDQVADHLQVSKRSVFNLIQKGELKSFKVGGSRRVTWQALDEFISRQDGAA